MRALAVAIFTLCATVGSSSASEAVPRGLDRVAHIIVLMQENHSFDNYFGALPYVRGGLFHSATACDPGDHRCVDGLTCQLSAASDLTCSNWNFDGEGHRVTVFHLNQYCSNNPAHEWVAAHRDANFEDPNSATVLGDGFVRVNREDRTHTAMGFYTQADLPYYYALAETFAISDHHFSSVIGPTLPNRLYSMAATSFGHLLTNQVDDNPGLNSYRPISGSIFDLLDRHHVGWSEYYQLPDDRMTPPRPYGLLFRATGSPHFHPLAEFFHEVAAGRLQPVVFIDLRQHEHPPLDIRAGQAEVSKIIAALRNSPNWKDSILLLTYDENGGFYDHLAPPSAPTPDGIPPGACADRSDPPHSMVSGQGANCGRSAGAQSTLCGLARPREFCANFTSEGFRVPLVAISPFAKAHYISHRASDHTSILTLIENRFLDGDRLTARDAAADNLQDLFDFDHPPSIAALLPAPPPAARVDDPGCEKKAER